MFFHVLSALQSIFCLYTCSFSLIRSLVDPALGAFIVYGRIWCSFWFHLGMSRDLIKNQLFVSGQLKKARDRDDL